MIGSYRWRGGMEAYLRVGCGSPITLLVLPALFEEANRMRRFTVSLMRAVADQGIGTILPDLPGAGESLSDFDSLSLSDWLDAVDAVSQNIGKPLRTVAIRGGALLDGSADSGWRLAPESGERLLRDMVRATAFSQAVSPSELDRRARTESTRLAGSKMAPQFYTALAEALPIDGKYRTARLDDDIASRDVTLSGSKLWRTAEPSEDSALVTAASADIVSWAKTCGA
jgi:hypothetical protein